MNVQALKKVVGEYQALFIKLGITKRESPSNLACASSDTALSHCHWMLGKMAELIEAGELEKAVRWLCFIQGCVWTRSDFLFSITDFRNHIRTILE